MLELNKHSGIKIDQNNRIIFYGNKVGFVNDDKAVADKMFQCGELTEFLNEKHLGISWIDEVFDQMSQGKIKTDESPLLKNVRVYQLKSDANPMIKFVGYDELIKAGEKLNPENYRMVYDGKLGTNDLEEIYNILNTNHPADYDGHSLSMSDILELYDEKENSFYYVDRFGFKEIEFKQDQEQSQTLTM